MVNLSRYYTTRMVRSMSPTMTTSMTKIIKPSGATALPLCLCTYQMLRRAERLSSPMQR
jgi:hypothetical protein